MSSWRVQKHWKLFKQGLVLAIIFVLTFCAIIGIILTVIALAASALSLYPKLALYALLIAIILDVVHWIQHA